MNKYFLYEILKSNVINVLCIFHDSNLIEEVEV